MWQQVSGQINTRFPGFLWCNNPGCGGRWPWGCLASCFLALFFQVQLHLWIWQHWAKDNYPKKSRSSAINGFAHIWDILGSYRPLAWDAQTFYQGVCGWFTCQMFPLGVELLVNSFTSTIHNSTSVSCLLREAPGVFQLISQIALSHNLVLSALK